MRIPIIAALAVATAACGSSGQNNAVPAAAANAPEPAGNQVAALSEGQRNAVFIRAIRDAGQDCQHVEYSTPAGRYQDMPVWRATCQGGGEWSIVIGADGTAQVVPGAVITGNGQSAVNAASEGNRQN